MVNVPVVVEIVRPLYLPPVISPVVSAIVTAEFCTSLPVVPSNRTTALSVEDAGPTTSPVAVLVNQDRLPLPSVCKSWPFVPSSVGSVIVHAAVLLPDAIVTEFALAELYSFNAPLVVEATPSVVVAVPVPFTKVKAASPPNAPASLNWICVLEPPGEPPPPPPPAAHDSTPFTSV